MTYFLLCCFLCFSGVRSRLTPFPRTFDLICLRSVACKVGRTERGTILLPADKSNTSLLGFKACCRMHAWMCYPAQKYHNRYSSHDTCSTCTQKHTHTCCGIFIFEVSRPTAHCNWFMLTGRLGISRHQIKSVHTPTDKNAHNTEGMHTRVSLLFNFHIYPAYKLWFEMHRDRKTELVGAQGATRPVYTALYAHAHNRPQAPCSFASAGI